MKKIALVLMGAAMLFAFVSCGSKPEPEPETTPEAPEEVIEEQVEEEPAAPVVEEKKDDAAEKADKAARANAKKLFESALTKKKDIEESEIAEYDLKHYNEGNRLLAELEAIINDDSIPGAELEEKANAIHAQYNTVLVVGYKKLANYWRDEAYASKKKADSVKAGVAEKARYQKAVKDFKEGDTLYAMQASEKACNRYIDADEEFNALYEELKEKRAAAEAAIAAAKKAVAAVEVIAVEADVTDPVKDGTEGIEAEDAVLLEEETYADPEDSVEQVPETMTEAVVENVTDFASKASDFLGGDK